jgi:Fe-S cluster biogenesis protein NfuA
LEYEKGQTFIFGFYHIRKKRENAMIEKIEKALEEIRPSLQADGGDVEFVSVENGIVKVRLTGACGGCPMSQMTLKQGIEKFVKKTVPEVLSVEAVQP